MFKISNDELPSNLSMFAYVSVALSNANTNVSYFYEPATFEIIPPGTNAINDRGYRRIECAVLDNSVGHHSTCFAGFEILVCDMEKEEKQGRNRIRDERVESAAE